MPWTEIVAVGALGALVIVYFRVILPFRDVRKALRRLAGGDFRPVLLHQRGLFRETAGHVRQISELLQQLDQQIADEGFSLRAILSSMVEGVLITDRAQRVRLANDPLHRMFDLKQSPINRTLLEVFRNHELQQAVEQTLFDGRPRKIEITLRSQDNETAKHLEVYAGGLNPRPHARPLGVVIVFHDVTALKNLEAVRREFVANVSHEFRTPLAIINGYIETLLDGALDDRPMAEKFLGIMNKNGQRLNLLIQDLLTISRLEHKSSHLEFQPANLHDVMQRVIERLEPAITKRHATVQVDWHPDAEEVEADPPRMEQVFANLLENALRHGPPENGIIVITGRPLGREVEIVFADNGPGIPFEDQAHIFERFYRVQKDRSRNSFGGGTGLGLSIVKHLVLAHGGHVSVESTPGQGAAFRVVVPTSQAERRD